MSNLITAPAKEVAAQAPRTASVSRVSDDTISDLTGMFKLLADRSRLKIVLALAEQGPMHVTALCEMLGQTQPAVSHHLTLMRMVGLVGFDRNGKHNYYYLASDYLRNLLEQFFADAGMDESSLQFDEFSLTYARRTDD
ncbi:MAG: metalloregulator ArsR/SmtB family transcription factor [Gemmataceae bacterium]